ncbi:hypothetical protein CRG98_032059 [Punica granatum]|uniref:Transposase MuDR plant domain-containing protein n=1 Tax=Punica granatum TaxID=22663 RepID=A0A2I0ITZ1_PUNGR|nr:hypothetical protein CRG98_032059 [Punica granatum]
MLGVAMLLLMRVLMGELLVMGVRHVMVLGVHHKLLLHHRHGRRRVLHAPHPLRLMDHPLWRLRLLLWLGLGLGLGWITSTITDTYLKYIIADPLRKKEGKFCTVGQPKAATEENAFGSLRRKGVDTIIDPVAEESEETSSSGSESDFAYRDVAADLSEEDDPKLEDIRSQVQIVKKKRAEKLKSLRLRNENDLETTISEARQDKQDNKGKEKEGFIVAVDAGDEGYITDYPSSNEACSINSGESSSEFGDDEDGVREKEPKSYFKKLGTFPQYESTCALPTFSVGQLFEDGKQFKDAISLASVKTQRNLYFKKNCKEYIRVRCKETSYPWKIVAKFMKSLGAYQVRKFFDNHTCNITYKNSRVNSKWLARHYMGTIRSLPSIKLNELKKLVKEHLSVEVSRSQCRRAKEKVYDLLVGDSKAEYALMWFYADELKSTNRNSSIYMKVERPIPAKPPIFYRFYVCFDALKTGFVKGCRQIIGVDGCFLKTVVKGQLLTAIGRDGNNQMFPIAWAVVQVESRDTCLWFLSLLKDDLNITDGLGWSIISDQQDKGLDPSECVHSFYKKVMFLEAYEKDEKRHGDLGDGGARTPTINREYIVMNPGSVGELLVGREADHSRQIATVNQLQAQAQRRSNKKKSETKKDGDESQGHCPLPHELLSFGLPLSRLGFLRIGKSGFLFRSRFRRQSLTLSRGDESQGHCPLPHELLSFGLPLSRLGFLRIGKSGFLFRVPSDWEIRVPLQVSILRFFILGNFGKFGGSRSRVHFNSGCPIRVLYSGNGATSSVNGHEEGVYAVNSTVAIS